MGRAAPGDFTGPPREDEPRKPALPGPTRGDRVDCWQIRALLVNGPLYEGTAPAGAPRAVRARAAMDAKLGYIPR